MIDYNTIIVPENPAGSRDAIALLTRVFGAEEAALDKMQLTGCETAYNTDVLMTATEDGVLLGMIYLTVPKSFPQIAGASGMCTSPEARGRGAGKKLFQMLTEECDRRGVEAAFLGTNNPFAARIYFECGFSFITGTNVMARCAGGKPLYDFYKTYYAPSAAVYQKGDPSFRIPVIPLAAARGRDLLMDANTGIFSSAYFTEPSCMGLYPRYLELEQKGGAFFGARLPSGALCALASVLPTPQGNQADAFAYPGFESMVPDLLTLCEETYPDTVARISDADTAKAEVFASLGYQPESSEEYKTGFASVPCRLWRKR